MKQKEEEEKVQIMMLPTEMTWAASLYPQIFSFHTRASLKIMFRLRLERLSTPFCNVRWTLWRAISQTEKGEALTLIMSMS